MVKKIKDLTDKQLFLAIYKNDDLFKLITYQDRKSYPDDINEPAKDISWDNCRFCKRHNTWCFGECKRKDIDFNEIRNSIYAEDEVEIDEK